MFGDQRPWRNQSSDGHRYRPHGQRTRGGPDRTGWPRPMIGKDSFQETDITGITLPITKHNWLVMDTKDLAEPSKKPFTWPSTGRPGPVLVDIPKDVFQNKTQYTGYPTEVKMRGYNPTVFGHARQIKQAAKMINEAQRPVILHGHGVTVAGAYQELTRIGRKSRHSSDQYLAGSELLPDRPPPEPGNARYARRYPRQPRYQRLRCADGDRDAL